MGSPSPSSGPKLKRSSSTSRAGPHRRSSSSVTSSSYVSLESGDQDLLQYSSPANSVTGTGKNTNVPSSPRTPAAGAASPAALKKRRSSIGGLDDLAKGLDFSNISSSPLHEEKKLHSFLTKGGGHKKVSPAVAQASSSPGKKSGPVTGKEKLTVAAGRATLSPRKSIEISKKDTPSSPGNVPEVSRSMNGITTPKKSSPLRASLDRKLSSPRLTPKSLGRTSELAAADALLQGDSIIKTERKPSPSPSLRSKSSSAGRKLTPSPPQLGRARTRTDNHAELSRPEMESVTVYSQYEFDRDAAKKPSGHINMMPDHINMMQHDEEVERSTLLASLIQVSGNDVNVGGETLDHEPTSWLSEDNVCMFSSLSQLPDDMSLLADPPIKTLDDPVSSNGYLLDSMVSSPVEASNGVYDQHGSLDHELNSFCDMLDDPVDGFEAQLCTEKDAIFYQSLPQDDTFEAELRTQIETTFDSPQLLVPQFVVPVAVTSSIDKGETMLNEDVPGDNQSIEAFLQSCSSQDLHTGEAQSQPISIQGPSEEAPMSFLDGVDEILQLDQFAEHLISASNVTLEEERRTIDVEDEISTADQQVVESSDEESLEIIIEDSQLNLKQSFDDVAESRSRDVDEIDHANHVPVLVDSPREGATSSEPYTIGLQELALSTESEFAYQFLDGPTYSLDQDMKIFEEDWTHSSADDSDAGQHDHIEDLLLNTAEDEAEKSLPPVELPVSVLPVISKLKVTVEESGPHAITLEIVEEIPPKDGLASTVSLDNHHAEVGATKVEIAEESPLKDDPDSTVSLDNHHAEVGATNLEFLEEIPPKDDADSIVSLDNHQVNTTYQDEESDEVFHLYGAGPDEVILFDHLSSPSRPEDIIQAPLNPMFEDVGESAADSHKVDTTHMEMDAQNRDLEGVIKYQEFSIKTFPPQDTSGDDDDSFSGTGEVCTDQAPLSHEEPPTSSNALNGVHMQYFDDHSEYVHLEGPDLSLGTPNIQDGSLETSGVSERHIAHEVLEPSPENPENFYAGCVQTGDRNQDDCSHSSDEKEFSGPLIVEEAAATDENSHDLNLKISPKLSEVAGDQTLRGSPHSGAIVTTTEFDPSESNAFGGINLDKEYFTEANIMEEESSFGDDGTTTSSGERIENSFLGTDVQMNFGLEEHQGLYNLEEGADTPGGKFDKEHLTEVSMMEEESFYGDNIGTTTTNGERQERIENSILGPEVQLNLEHQGLHNSAEGADVRTVFTSSELRDNSFQDISTARDIEVPAQDSSQIHGDEEFQENERISASALVESSHGCVNMSEVDHKQLASSPTPVTLEDCSASDGNSVCASTERSLPKGVHGERVTFDEEDDTISDQFDANSEVISTAPLQIGAEAPTASPTGDLGKDEVPLVISAKEVPLNEVNGFDRPDQTICEVHEESSVCADDHSEVGSVILGEQSKVELDTKEIKPVDPTEDQYDPLREESDVIHGRVNPCSPTQEVDARGDTADQDLVIDEASSIVSATPSELTEHHDPDSQETQFLELGTSISSNDQEDAPEVEQALSDAHFDEDLPEEDVINDAEIISGNSSSQGLPLKLCLDTPNAHDESLNEDIIPWKGDTKEETLEQHLSPEEVDSNVEKLFILSDTSSSDVKREEDSRDNVYSNGGPILSEDEEKVVFSPKNSNGCASFGSDTKIMDITGTSDIDEDEDVTEKSLLEIEDTSDGANGPIAECEKDCFDEHIFLKDEDMAMESSKDSDVEQSNSSWNSLVCKKEDVLEDKENGADNVLVQETPETRVLDVCDVQNHSLVSWSTAENNELESSNGSCFEEESMLEEDEDTVVYRSMESFDESGQHIPDSTPLLADEKADPEEVKLNGEVVSEVGNTIFKAEEEIPGVEEAIVEAQEMVVDNHEELPLDVEIDTNAEALMVDEETNGGEEASNEDIVEKESVMEMVDHSPTFESCTALKADAGDIDVEKEIQHPTWRTDEEGEASLEDRSMLEEKEVGSPEESLVISDENNTIAAISDVEKEIHTRRTDEEGETSLENRSMPEEKEVSSPKESLVNADEDSTNAAISDLEKEIQHPTWRIDEEGETLLEERSMFEEEEVSCPRGSLVISDEDSTNAAISDVEEEIQHPTWRTDEGGETLLEERSMFEEEKVSCPKGSLVISDEDSTNAAISDVEEEIQHPTWRTDEGGETLLEERSMFEEEEVSCPKESLVISDDDSTNAAIFDVEEEIQHPTWRTDEGGETLLEERSMFEEEEVRCPKESLVISDEDGTNAAIFDVEEEIQHPTWRTDEEGETLLEDRVVFEEKEVSSPKESYVNSGERNTNADISEADEWESTSNGSVEEESVVQMKDQENSSSGNVLACQVPESGSESLQSDNMREELECYSNGAMTSEKDALDNISKDAVKVEKAEASSPKESLFISDEGNKVNADHISDPDEGESTSNENTEEETVAQLKDQENSTSSGHEMTVCQAPDSVSESLQSDGMGEELERPSNGAMTSDTDAADISKDAVKVENSHRDHVDEGQFISQDSETLALVKETWINNLERTPQDMDSPAQESQALYPLQPPFSGSKQDHLWEEQAETYSSGGQGTPKAAAPSSSEAQPFPCDDQIQPASAGNPLSKEKLRTPLRSLLLEDAHKALDGDASTSNGSPSFIRRLFRVKSTPSRAPSERDLSQSKLKKPTSMWVSCLGSPQVKQ